MRVVELLGQEWVTLQNNFEQYERGGLTIKLVSLLVVLAGLVLNLDNSLLAGLVLVLWLQEAIFRTFQSRLGQRILRLESLIAEDAPSPPMHRQPFQLHSEWLASRKGGVSLLQEYAASAFRPTVAYPYVLFVAGLVMPWAELLG